VIVSVGTPAPFCQLRRLDAKQHWDCRGFRGRDRTLTTACSDAQCRPILDVDQDGLSRLPLSAPAGADGLVLLPYPEGERAPALPDSTGASHGLGHKTSAPAHLTRAAAEGLLRGLAGAPDALECRGVDVERVRLIGGGSRSKALR
jgi:xylulokinase